MPPWKKSAWINVCLQLERRSPLMVEATLTKVALDDQDVIKVGNALFGNTYIRTFAIRVKYNLTAKGAKALANAICKSSITSFTLQCDYEIKSKVTEILFQALEPLALEELCLEFPMKDDDATQLEKSITGKPLTKFLFQLGRHLTAQGACALSKIVHHSQHVEICEAERTAYDEYSNVDEEEDDDDDDTVSDDGNSDANETDGPITSVDLVEVMDDAQAPDDTMLSVLEILLQNGVQGPGAIRSLTLEYFSVTDVKGLTSVLAYLDKLSLNDCEGLANIERLSIALGQTTGLVSLELSGCSLGDNELTILSKGLGANLSIKTLDLSFNYFDDAGIQAFVDNWRFNSPLEQLMLNNNDIGSVGAIQLLHGAANHPALRCLDLSCNKSMPEKEAGLALLEAVKSNVHLHKVMLHTNKVTPEAVKKIAFVLAANRMGRYLLQDNLAQGSSVWADIFAKCKNDFSLIYFFLCEQPPLVRPSLERSPKRQRLM